MIIFELNIFGLTIAPTYYGLMYAISFIIGFFVIKNRKVIMAKDMDNLLMYIFAGVILGGRFGYIVFYNLSYYSKNILDVFKVWEGGMSFHGGVLGVIVAMLLFSKKYKYSFLKVSDEITYVLPIGLGLGRFGNYLNKELLGYEGYNGILAVKLNGFSYFPSPLLESFLEGIVLFIILFFVNKNKQFAGQIACLFLIFYGIFRLIVEYFFRTPDSHIGYIIGNFSMGALLSIFMILFGFGIYIFIKDKKSL